MKFSNLSVLTGLILCLLLFIPTPALTGQEGITQLQLNGANPGRLELFQYAPDNLSAGAPLIVVLHGCGQTAKSMAVGSGWINMAREHQLALLLPQQTRANNPATCFNWFSPEHAGPGGTEVRSVVAAVDRMIEAHDLDPSRIFVTGLSAGGSMAAALLAAHPERFAGGGVIAGVAVGCAENMAAAFSCMRGGDGSETEELGDRILAASDHTGPWPRISIWHGDNDSVVRPRNLDALMRQWTDVHGIDQKATSVQRIGPAERRRFEDTGGIPVETWLIQDMDHGMPTSTEGCGQDGDYMHEVGLCAPRHLLAFWGLAESPVTEENATTSKGWNCVETVSTNYRHIEMGRGKSRFGMVYAEGSGDRLGLYISPFKTTVAETTSGYWERGNCPE